MFSGNVEDFFRLRPFKNLIDGVKFLRFRQMADVACVQNEYRGDGQPVDFFNGRLQRGGDVGIRGLVEAHVAIADLHEAEISGGFLSADARKVAEAVRIQHAAFDYAESAGAGPSHAFEKTAAVDTVVIVVVQDYITILLRHSASPVLLVPLVRSASRIGIRTARDARKNYFIVHRDGRLRRYGIYSEYSKPRYISLF